MLTTEYDRMHKMEKNYWWFAGRRYLVKRHLEKIDKLQKILDIGCGTGEMLSMLKKYGDVVGVDIAESALNYCRKRGLKVQKSNIIKMPFDDNSFDVITMLDILEHVKNDHNGLKEVNRICKPRGKVLITVPAYNILWSDHDRALKHFRRYTAKEMMAKLDDSGFKTIKYSYVITTLFLPILIFRLVQKILPKKSAKSPKTSLIFVPKPINSIFIILLKIEAQISRFVSIPFGVSIIILAEKQ